MGFLGGVLGGIAGSQKDETQGTATSTVTPGAMMQGQQAAMNARDQAFANYQNYAAQGPGANAISSAFNSSQNLAGMFNQYAQTGGAPNASMLNNAQGYAKNLFAPQQTALQQSFLQSNINESRLAGQLGRPVNDPTLQAKLQLGQQQQQSMLNAQQGAFANQYANQLSQNSLRYAAGGNQILNGLASQAFQNQAAILGMGNEISNAGMNWQLQTASRQGSQDITSGGGLKGGIEGFMGGMGMGMQAQGYANSMGGWGNLMGMNSLFGGGGGFETTGAMTDMGAASAGGMGNAAGLALLA